MKNAYLSFSPQIRWMNKIVWMLLFFIAAFVFHLQIVSRNQILSSAYRDVEMQQKLRSLIDANVIYAAKDEVRIDETRLAALAPSSLEQKRIRSFQPFFEIIDGTIRLDPSFLTIQYRASAGRNASRGDILDCTGRILASGSSFQRTYPMGVEMAPIIGILHPVYGVYGLEEKTKEALSPSFHRSWLQGFLTFLGYRANEEVHDVILTVNANVQHAAWEAMSEYEGAAALMDIRTGDLLAAVSKPSFLPDAFDFKTWKKIRNDANALKNRAFDRRYPPGSTFKPVIAAAYLENKIEGVTETYFCTGRHRLVDIDCLKAHGKVDLEQAIVQSCNGYFAEMSVKLGKRGKDMAEAFGFNQRYDLMPDEFVRDYGGHYYTEPSFAFDWVTFESTPDPETGRLLNRPVIHEYSGKDFQRNYKEIARCGIGQLKIEATPLEMACVAATIANGGYAVKPRIIKALKKHGDAAADTTYRPALPRRAIGESTSRRLREAMTKVMETGTGKGVPKLVDEPAFVGRGPVDPDARWIKVAGKTGTAEVAGGEAHSWFIGFAPADEPRYAVSVICEHAGFGSLHAAPVAVEILKAALGI